MSIDLSERHQSDRQGLSDELISFLRIPSHMLDDDQIELRCDLVHRVDLNRLFPGPKYRRLLGIFDGYMFYHADYGIISVPENMRWTLEYLPVAPCSFKRFMSDRLKNLSFNSTCPTIGTATVGVDYYGFPNTEVLEAKE